eukprot:m.207966 g.207966  ORF g.207966 m.207966 type:complete len:121 (+) comp15036_c0_seq1:253-615(+)
MCYVAVLMISVTPTVQPCGFRWDRVAPELLPNITNFDDLQYQASLPSYARSTAAFAVKNNLKQTELESNPSEEAVASKAHTIIAQQQKLKQLDRAHNPARYGIKPPRATGHRVKPIAAAP